MSFENRGSYLVVEGADGVGKTTQAKLLRQVLENLNLTVADLIEPGGTPVGAAIRAILLNADLQKLPESEFDLFTIARQELAYQVIEPKINEGITLVSDRNWFSSVAYQGFGRGMDVDYIIEKSKKAMGDFFMPDGIVILDVPTEVTEERLLNSRAKADWFEKQGREFFERVSHGYHWLAEHFDVEVIDGSPGISEVGESIFVLLGSIAIDKTVG